MAGRKVKSNINIDEEKLLEKTSCQHHYIPQFITRAFTNEQGKVFVFDKRKNKILSRPQSPKSIFWEEDRNTVPVKNGIESSFIEEFFYSRIDDEASKIIAQFQYDDLSSLPFTDVNREHLLFFLVALFWRIPSADYATDVALNTAEIIAPGMNHEKLRSDPFFRKTQRVNFMFHMVEEMQKTKRKERTASQIHQTQGDQLVLGDNPILFRTKSDVIGELFYNDFIFSLSSKRVYSCTKKPFKPFSTINATMFNAAVISQSYRYVCASNRGLLERAIKTLDFYERNNLTHTLLKDTFTNHE